MPACKVCGHWFVKIKPQEELCDKCESALSRLSGYVAPVRHGRWDDEHKCTVCHNEAFFKISDIRPDYDYDWEENLVETGGYIWDTEWIETAYCPNCGAKMDLED